MYCFTLPCLTNTAIDEAILQLERRFFLIDGVLNIGFRRMGVYTGRVVVPYLPDSIEQRRIGHITLRRLPLPNSKTEIQDIRIRGIGGNEVFVIPNDLAICSNAFVVKMRDVTFDGEIVLDEESQVVEHMVKWILDNSYRITVGIAL